MRTPDDIPPQVRELQRAVADPTVSAWVAANAGSGKTHVLAQRVINLLLNEVPPEKILCITFTKAAAATMAKRVFDTLAAWTTLDDAALDKAILDCRGAEPTAAQRATARCLFARALETPGGLKVQTIHAFCTQLLHRFPFESNVAARFAVLDDTERNQLLENLTLSVLLDGSREPDGPLGRALATAMTAAADRTFRDVIRETIGRRDAIVRWVQTSGGVDAAIAELSHTLGLAPSESRESIEEEFFAGSSIAPSEWAEFAAVLAGGAKSDAEKAGWFKQLASLSRSDRVETYLDIFCTRDRAPRKAVVTKAIKDTALAARLESEKHRVCALQRRLCAVDCRDRTAALLTVAYEVVARFAAEKQRRGLLDYDDLIDKALALLDNVDAAWVHFKLDMGIDHLLIDEAQDTSSKQWQIIRRLVAEFTAGAGARPVPRTIFAVGDEKQSIYSFQNAAPKEFAEMRRHFDRDHGGAALPFVSREFKHSFRSGKGVLGAVDEVFKNPVLAASVTSGGDVFPPHLALPDAQPSDVEIWEPIEADPRPAIEGWDAPFDRVSATSTRVKLARRIAHAVRRLVERRTPVGIERRAVRYGDVLILVRQRGELFEAIIRALKNEEIAVAGADRLVLTEHIAVMDLMVLGDALLLPEDDLALATALRSPLFDFSDEELFEIAWNRDKLSLRAALRRKSPGNATFAPAVARLDDLAQRARQQHPFAFYAQILGADGARRRFLARLGHEANDALDEFLNLALDYERRETPTLQGFLAWLRQARSEVKRDMEIARNEVRVMTVHGAKGLEAPIVILADTMTRPTGPRPPRLLDVGAHALIWAGRKADDVPAMATARAAALAAAEDEYRRLLYVAMTRAADRLIVCGAEGERKRPEGCWYDLIRNALDPHLREELDGDEKVLRYPKTPLAAGATAGLPSEPAECSIVPELPSWLLSPAAGVAMRAEPLAPSTFDLPAADLTDTASAIEREKSLQRGRVVHRLMQALPDLPQQRRGEAMARYLAGAAGDFPAEERDAIARQVAGILDAPAFSELFVPESRAEVPIVGRLPRPDGGTLEVVGQVDRLTVRDDAVLIGDYKSDRTVPGGLDDVPPHYIAQIAVYRAVLQRLYPARTICAALVFTSGPALIEVPSDAMDRAVQKVLTAAR